MRHPEIALQTAPVENILPIELNPLSSHVFMQLQEIYNQTLNPKRDHWALYLLKGVSYLMAANAGIPYLILAYQYADNPYLGTAYAASIYVTLGSLSIWSVRKFSDYASLIRSNPKTNQCAQLFIITLSIILGVGSAVPGALITLKYNSAWFLPLSLFFDLSTNSSSFNILFRKIYNDFFLYRKYPGLRNQRDLIVAFLYHGVHNKPFHMLPLSPADIQPIVNEFYAAGQQFLPLYHIRNAHPNIFDRGLLISSNVLGFLLPLSWGGVTFYLTYQSMIRDLSMPRFFSGLIGVFATLPIYFLEFVLGTSLMGSIYTLIAYKCFGRSILNPALIHHLKSTLAFLLLGYGFTSFAFAARSKVVVDLISEPLLLHAILSWVIVSTLTIKIASITDNILGIQNNLMALHLNKNSYIRHELFEKYRIVLNTLPPNYVQSLIQSLRLHNMREPLEPDEAEEVLPDDGAIINNPFTLLAHKAESNKDRCCGRALGCHIL